MFRSLLNGGGSWVAVSRRLPSSVARDDTVGFASRTLCIRKILLTGDALEDIDYMPCPGLEDLTAKADEKTVAAVLADMDTAARTHDDAKMLAAIGGIDKMGVNFETGINGVYNLCDRDANHYCVFGGTKVLKSTDGNVARGPVKVVKVVDVAAAMPPEAPKAVTRIIGLK